MEDTLFDDRNRYKPKAAELTREMDKLLRPIFDQYVVQGFSVREISHIMLLAVMDAENETILGK